LPHRSAVVRYTVPADGSYTLHVRDFQLH